VKFLKYLLVCLLLICAIVPANAAFSMVETAQGTNGTSGNSMTFTSLNVGSASSGRIILCLITSRFNQSTATVGTVTIGGISATQVSGAQFSNATTQDLFTDAWYAVVPTGTTATVVVTLSFGGDTMDRTQVGLYAITGGLSTPTAAFGGSASSSGTSSMSVTVPSGGQVACAWMDRLQVGGVTWHNATVDATTTVPNVGSGTNSDVSIAHATSTASVSVTDAGSDFSSVIVGVAWAPSAAPTPVPTRTIMGVGE
jgi:hypothetical protein